MFFVAVAAEKLAVSVCRTDLLSLFHLVSNETRFTLLYFNVCSLVDLMFMLVR